MIVISETYYIESAETVKERIERVSKVITALEEQSLRAAEKSSTDSYQFDDGQISVNMSYRSPLKIARAIQFYESLKIKLINRLNGRDVALRDWRGLW